MTKSLIRVVNELSSVSSQSEKERLSVEASNALLKRQEYANSILIPIVESLKRSVDLYSFKTISEGEFYDLEIRPYYDVDGIFRISIQISFLQDFNEPDTSLNEKVGLFLFNEILKRNLDILVNDICINDVQFRNGTLK